MLEKIRRTLLIPTLSQWRSWSLPSKLTAAGFFVGVISLVITIYPNSPSISSRQNNHTPDPKKSDITSIEIKYKQCGYLKGWDLPSQTEFSKMLDHYPGRYTNEDFGRARTKKIHFFTLSGVSLEGDALRITGLFNVPDQYFCHKFGDRLERTNTGELWLIFHEIRRLEWNGKEYIATVYPTQTGAQFIEFPRHEVQEAPKLFVKLENDQVIEKSVANEL
ncbi:MAG: hypothetical protein KDH16_23630 [Rhodocyclaceae bacterium]|nr:hypothetical protein [Rhodocyclaceae bacterium]MCP5311197.1 hypothetical protein [Zoogloeaceae bacterium]